MTKTTVIATDKEHLEKLIQEAIQAEGFKCSLNHIDVSQVTDMRQLFSVSKFNGDISSWNTSKVQDMRHMFYNSQFNGDISAWDTSKVQNMRHMFQKSIFQGNIAAWNVSKVTDMRSMFQNSIFNENIAAWNVSQALDMFGMFWGSHFNGDISAWSFNNDADIDDFFDAGKLDQFEIPNMYHWGFLLKGFVTRNVQWQDHVDAYAPIARSLSYTKLETAMLINKAWQGRQFACETALAVPYEFREYS